jgi:hypothetical protein
MDHSLSLGFISLLLLVSLAGFCVADEAPGSLVYIQGGESFITNGTDSGYVITVKDIIPYFHFTDGEKSSLFPVDLLTNLTYPVNAALVLSSENNETAVMVQVSNMSLSDGEKILILQAEPLKYYEGERLTSYNDKSQSIYELDTLRFSNAGVYLEIEQLPPPNFECPPGYVWCGLPFGCCR